MKEINNLQMMKEIDDLQIMEEADNLQKTISLHSKLVDKIFKPEIFNELVVEISKPETFLKHQHRNSLLSKIFPKDEAKEIHISEAEEILISLEHCKLSEEDKYKICQIIMLGETVPNQKDQENLVYILINTISKNGIDPYIVEKVLKYKILTGTMPEGFQIDTKEFNLVKALYILEGKEYNEEKLFDDVSIQLL